jgi:hypothetical protein
MTTWQKALIVGWLATLALLWYGIERAYHMSPREKRLEQQRIWRQLRY